MAIWSKSQLVVEGPAAPETLGKARRMWTDGNLSVHARKLEDAEHITPPKSRGRRTEFALPTLTRAHCSCGSPERRLRAVQPALEGVW